MRKPKLELSKKVKEVFTGSEVGVLVEDFTSQVKLVAEGVSGLNDKFDNLETKADRLETKVDRLDVKVDKIETDVEVIKVDIEFIKHELRSRVSRDEFIVLEHRVTLLENRR